MAKPDIVLIDGMNLVWRSHYAFRELHDSHRRPTGVLYGALRAILDVQTRYTPEILCCWDSRQSWRREVFTEYKSKRKVDRRDLEAVWQQVPTLRTVLDHALGVGNLECDGLEADDLLSILAHALVKRRRVLLLSNDRDLYQILQCPDVVVLSPKAKKLREVTAKHVEREFTLPIEKWACYLAAGGDQSDNVKAFPGIGQVRAAELVRLGLRPNRPHEQQPAEVRQRLVAFAQPQEWQRFIVIYRLVRLPKTVRSHYLPLELQDGAKAMVAVAKAYHRKFGGEQQVHEFTKFCVKYDLSTLLAKRREFFQWTQKTSSHPT